MDLSSMSACIGRNRSRGLAPLSQSDNPQASKLCPLRRGRLHSDKPHLISIEQSQKEKILTSGRLESELDLPKTAQVVSASAVSCLEALHSEVGWWRRATFCRQ